MVRNKLNRIIIKSIAMASILTMIAPNIINATRFTQSVTSREPDTTTESSAKTIIVLDPGHGKSSGSMSDEEKTAAGFVQNSSGAWGEWRHWANNGHSGTCDGTSCTGPKSTGENPCWYPIANGDRNSEPTINLNNAEAAKACLETMGYEVRMTRTSNDTHPSFTKRASYCFPNNDTSQTPDAELYVCIHSNASDGSVASDGSITEEGSERGTAYMYAEGSYSQDYIPSDYAKRCNKAGELINNKISELTGLENDGTIKNQEWLIAFNKNPVPTAYLEIGYFDNSSDLAILKSKSDEIGKAIAEGIHEYLDTLGKASKTDETSSSGTTTTAAKGTIAIDSNEEKFLGLWKNSVGSYVPYYEDPEKAKYNPDGQVVKYGSYGSAGEAILNADYWFFDLLSATDRTQQHLQLMKYLMQKYSGNDYGAEKFDFNTFDIDSFSSIGGGSGGGYTFTGSDTILWRNNYSKEDFVNWVKNFEITDPNSTGETGLSRKEGWKLFYQDKAEEWFDICTNNGIDPLIIMSWSCNEAYVGTSKIARDKANLWGWRSC